MKMTGAQKLPRESMNARRSSTESIRSKKPVACKTKQPVSKMAARISPVSMDL